MEEHRFCSHNTSERIQSIYVQLNWFKPETPTGKKIERFEWKVLILPFVAYSAGMVSIGFLSESDK